MADRHTFLLSDDSAADRDVFKQMSALRPRHLTRFADIERAARSAGANDWWIALNGSHATQAVRAAAGASLKFGYFVVVGHMADTQLPPLLACCRRVVLGAKKALLPFEEFAEVLASPNRQNLLIGGTADSQSETLTFWRGDGSSFIVSFKAFRPSAAGLAPNFKALAISDYGQTIKLGDYEASAEAVLFENDPEYRRVVKQKRRQEDVGFGASLRRLRRTKGLSRDDFDPLSSKTIARIEQVGGKRPSDRTLSVIERVVGLPVDEIETF